MIIIPNNIQNLIKGKSYEVDDIGKSGSQIRSLMIWFSR